MKILLLGAKGNLGTAFFKKSAVFTDHVFIGWDKDDIDVTDRMLLVKKIKDLQPEIIINTVAYNDVDGAEKNDKGKQLADILNHDLVQTLAEVALDENIVLVHYSTDYVFSGELATGYNEAAEVAPINEYGNSKARGEKEIIRLSGRGLRWYIIRTSRLFGDKGQGKNAKPSFFELMTTLSKTNTELKAVSNESGSFTYTPDLVSATISLLESGDGFGIYHLINDGKASWFEAATYFFKKINPNITVAPVKGEIFLRAARRPKKSRLLNTKRPKLRTWQAAIDEYIQSL